MNDLGINKALALAIGYSEDRIRDIHGFCQVQNNNSRLDGPMQYGGWQRFDYRDSAVIWPVAERYDCFPRASAPDWWTVWDGKKYYDANTDAKAVALAVIGRQEDGKL